MDKWHVLVKMDDNLHKLSPQSPRLSTAKGSAFRAAPRNEDLDLFAAACYCTGSCHVPMHHPSYSVGIFGMPKSFLRDGTFGGTPGREHRQRTPRSEAMKICGNRGTRMRSHKLTTFALVE